MNSIPYTILRLWLLVALALISGGVPTANATQPQQPAPPSCVPASTPAMIIGVVRDGNGQPIAGVNVTAHATTDALSASGVTNAGGEYRIQLQPGRFLLEFRPGQSAFQTAWYKGGNSPLDATALDVASGETAGGIDMTLVAGAQFSVALRDPEGNAVGEGVVSVFDRNGRRVATGQSDDAGRALTVPGLPPGTYRLFVQPPYGSPLLPHYANDKATLDAADPITLTQALTTEVALPLQRGARLSGTVTDAATNTPLAGIAVNVRDAGDLVRDATTDAAGRYSVAGLPSGTYAVEFRAMQPIPAAPAPLRRVVTLTAPNTLSDFDVALTPGGSISGLITTPDGTPIAAASVTARDADGTRNIHGSTEADGTYTIHGLASGRYTLSVGHYSYQGRVLADQVTVTAATTTTVATTVLAPGGAISGKVTDPDGKPVAGVYVSVMDAASGNAQEGSAYTNNDGAYTTPATLPNGSYVVKFQPPSRAGYCPLAIEYSGNAATAATATRVTISGPTTTTGIDAKLDYGGHITGRITEGASGLPLESAVWVYDSSGALVTNGYGSLGYYRTAAALPAGNYRVQFLADGYVPLFYGGATVLEAAARVPSGASNINIALPRGGTITGRVTAGDTGASLEYALVTLYGAGDRVIATQLTAFDGSYRFKGSLPSGAYRLGVAPGKRDDGTPFFTGYEPVFSGGASSLEGAQLVSLVAPKTVSVDLPMPTTSAPPTPPTTPTDPTSGSTQI